MAKISTKHPAWQNIERVGVRFKDGKAETKDEAAIRFFRRQSGVYTVVEDRPRRQPNGGSEGS